MFTAESFGGPDDFSRELGFRHLIDVHRGLRITDEQRQRFIGPVRRGARRRGRCPPTRRSGTAVMEQSSSGPRSPQARPTEGVLDHRWKGPLDRRGRRVPFRRTWDRRRRGRGTRWSRSGRVRRWPGSPGRPGGSAARARPTASALSAPLTTNHTSSERFRAGKVRVTRSGGGLGEPVTPTAISSSTASWGKPGNSEATWPSGPTPSISRSKLPDPPTLDRTVSAYAAAAASTEADVAGGRDLVHPGRVDADGVQERRAGLRGVALVGVWRHEPLVAPEELDPRPVDVAARREPGDLAVDPVGDGAAGQRDLRHVAGRLPHREPGAGRHRRRPWRARRPSRAPRREGPGRRAGWCS